MGEEAAATTTLTFTPSAFFKPSATAASSYLGPFKQTKSELGLSPAAYHFDELHESDVVWSSTSSFSSAFDAAAAAADDEEEEEEEENGDGYSTQGFSSGSPSLSSTPSLPPASFSPTGHLRRSFLPESRGLSAVLTEDRVPQVLQRRQAASPVAVPGRGAEATATASTGGGGGGEFPHLRHQSAPMNIPAWPKWKKASKVRIFNEVDDGKELPASSAAVAEEAEEEEDEEEEMVPPHVIVARSHATTFSVFEGVGRTLKGRDLRRVRNAVLQRTGFLDL